MTSIYTKHTGTKESVNKKRLPRIRLGHQHGLFFIVLEHHHMKTPYMTLQKHQVNQLDCSVHELILLKPQRAKRIDFLEIPNISLSFNFMNNILPTQHDS